MRIAVAFLACCLTLGAADALTVFGRQWSVPSAADWSVVREGGAEILAMTQGHEPLPGPRRPYNFALADAPPYSRLTVEADVKPLVRSLMIVFAYRDEAHFDYAHLSTDTATKAPVHNGIFHVYGGERVRISDEAGPAAFAATGRWYHVRLTHDATSRTVVVLVDNRPVAALRGTDMSLGAGKVGIGSFDETAEFKNVKIAFRGLAGRR